MRILTYDLNEENSLSDYDNFYAVIGDYDHKQLSESCYALNTRDHPSIIYQKLKPFIDDNDYVLVITLTRPMNGFHLKEVNSWLQERI